MEDISRLYSIILPIIYFISVVFYGFIFYGRNKNLAGAAAPMIFFLLILHTGHISFRAAAIENFPLITKFDALSLLAFFILSLELMIQKIFRNKAAGFFALILAFIIQAVSSIFFNWNIQPNTLLENWYFITHVLMTTLGYTAISISALYALLYLLLNYSIKHHRLGILYAQLPPLRILEKMSIYAVRIGIAALGFGILLGHVLSADLLKSFWPNDAKVWFSSIIWFGYFAGYIISQLQKWRGRWMAVLSISGFGILILANITIIFIKDTFHNFH